MVNTPLQLFGRRLRANALFQYKLVRMAVDWTVALYLVIPAIGIAGYHYVLWLREPPAWLAAVPVTAFVALLFLFACSGGWRWYAEDADQLVLLPSRRWLARMRLLALAWGVLAHAASTLALAALLLPLQRALPLPPQTAAWLFAAAGLLRLNLALARQWLRLTRERWWQRAFGSALLAAPAALALAGVRVAAGAAGGAALCAGGALVLGALWLCQARARLRARVGTFAREIELEREAKLRLARLLLSGFLDKPRRSVRSRPYAFRRSQLLFRYRSPISGLSEVLLKSFIRSPAQLRLYATFTAALCAGIALVPSAPVRTVVWLASAFLLSYWMKQYGKEAMTAPFVTMFPWRDRTRIGTLRKCTHLLTVPGFLLISLVYGYTVGAWLGIVLLAILGMGAAYLVAAVVTIWY